MKNQVEQKMLIERIGIDKSTISGFSLSSIDDERFRQKAKQEKGKIWYTTNSESSIELIDERKIGELLIESKEIGKLHIKYKKNNVTESGQIIATLDILSHDDGNNLQNMTCKEYRQRIADIFDTLQLDYGVTCHAPMAELYIKSIEFNATFWLNHPYNTYRWCLLLMERILPDRYAVGRKDNRRLKTGAFDSHYVRDFANKTYEDYVEDMKTLPLSKKETIFCKGNKSTELKIYHKNQQLIDVEATDAFGVTGHDAMRIEYKIKDNLILKAKRNFNGCLVKSLSDKKIAAFFKNLFKRDFVEQYRGWKAWNHRELLAKVDNHRKAHDKWTAYFLRDIREYSELNNGTPLLFDVEDVRNVLKELEGNPKKGNKKYRQFKKNLEFESDLIGNNDKMKEIFNKVLEM